MTNWVPMTRTTQLPSVTSVGGYGMLASNNYIIHIQDKSKLKKTDNGTYINEGGMLQLGNEF
jgi:hypothetical protein